MNTGDTCLLKSFSRLPEDPRSGLAEVLIGMVFFYVLAEPFIQVLLQLAGIHLFHDFDLKMRTKRAGVLGHADFVQFGFIWHVQSLRAAYRRHQPYVF